MNIEILLMLTVCATIFVTLSLSGMYYSTVKRLYKLEKEVKRHKQDIKTQSREIRVIKDRAAAYSDHVLVYHKYNDSDAPIYPSKEGL